jgi:anti-anti-sigma regulatory factor
MFLATINKSKQLLHASFIGHVRLEELQESREGLINLLAELEPGFCWLTDLERLESMGMDCVAEITKIMDLCDQKGVGLIIRVIPDHTKDVGLGILSSFHYHHRPRTVTCHNMVEAGKLLFDKDIG